MASEFELIPLFSGSSGNSILVKAGDINLLFDCGHNCKKITEALKKVDVDPYTISAIFLTHSHGDHISGADVFMRKYHIPVYATRDTMRDFLCKCTKAHEPEMDRILEDDIVFETLSKNIRVRWCDTPHDTAGSVCYRVDYGDFSTMIMTDLGHVTYDIREMAMGVNGILIEANYDEDMLIYGPYDYMLKKRVGGLYGHLSNVDCGNMMVDLIKSGTRKFILGHLSENNNEPGIALGTVVKILRENGFEMDRDYEIKVANRYDPTEAMVIS